MNAALTQMVSHPRVLHFITFLPSSISDSVIVTPHIHVLSSRRWAFLMRCLHVPLDGTALVAGTWARVGTASAVLVEGTKLKVSVTAMLVAMLVVQVVRVAIGMLALRGLAT